jgi:Lar family restriction alleviation protein
VEADKHTPEVLPCPFCESNDYSIMHMEEKQYRVECDGCGAGTFTGETRKEAIEKWNKRVLNLQREKIRR